MGIQRGVVPVTFGVLGAAFPLPLALAIPRFSLSIAVAVTVPVTAVFATTTWILVAGESPTKRRGAVSSVLGLVVGALVSAVILTSIATVVGASLSATVRGFGTLVLVSLVVAVPATLLGWVVASRPSLAPGRDVLPFPTTPDRTYRRLSVFCGLLLCVAVLTGAVQYADPVVGEPSPPAYDSDAPPETQVRQAFAITCAESFRANVSAIDYYKENSSEADSDWKVDREASSRWLVVRDPDQLRRKVVERGLDGEHESTSIYTEDGVWHTFEESPETISPLRPLYRNRRIGCELGILESIGGASIANETAESVTISGQLNIRSGGVVAYIEGEYDDDEVTMTIDTQTGRIENITVVRMNSEQDYESRDVTTIHVSEYGTASVERPTLPARPPRWHVFDVMVGPVFQPPDWIV